MKKLIVLFLLILCVNNSVNSQDSLVFSTDLDPTNRFLAIGTATYVEIRNVADDRIRLRIPIEGGVQTVKWSRDGQALAVIEWENRVSIWNVVTGESMGNIDGFGDEFGLTDIEWNLDNSQLFILDFYTDIMVWNIDWVTHIHTQVSNELYLGTGRDIELSPDGSMLAIAMGGVIRLRYNNTNPIQYDIIFKGFRDEYLTVSWNEDGSLLAAGGFWGPVRIWDVVNSISLPTPNENVESGVVQWLSTSTLASIGVEYTMRIWDINTNQLMCEFDVKPPSIVAWNTDESTLVTFNGTIHIISIPQEQASC